MIKTTRSRRALLNFGSACPVAQPLGRGWIKQGGRRVVGGGAVWTPAELFANEEVGSWYEPGPTTCYTDNGTTPAGEDDLVYRMDDLSGNGHHLIQATVGYRPILRKSGDLWYLEFDGVDDKLIVTSTAFTDDMDVFLGLELPAAGNDPALLFGSNTTSDYVSLLDDGGTLATSSQSGLYTPTPTRVNGEVVTVTDRDTLFHAVTGSARVLTINNVKLGGAPFGAKIIIFAYAIAGYEVQGRLYQLVMRDGPSTEQEIDNMESYMAVKTGVTL